MTSRDPEANISKTAGVEALFQRIANRYIMAYGASNDHLLDYVICPVFSILFLFFCLKVLRKTANIIEKTSVYHPVNGNCALFHTSKTAKMIKVILLSSMLTF